MSKIIHYCWFGGSEKPPIVKKCIDSWKEYFPDFEIMEWNEQNFDIHNNRYVEEAYQSKKYAFVSDVARFYALEKFGGLYFDTDVEIIKPIDDIIAAGPFMGFETDPSLTNDDASKASVAPGLGLGVNPSLGIIKKMLDFYEGKHFVHEAVMRNQITVVHIATQVLRENGLKNVAGIQEVAGCFKYPSEYFCPINVTTGRIHVEKNTRTIHHYAGTWVDKKFSMKEILKRFLPEFLVLALINIKNKIK